MQKQLKISNFSKKKVITYIQKYIYIYLNIINNKYINININYDNKI